jgi:alpha-beta hydrolase superfamily lysophospholipase
MTSLRVRSFRTRPWAIALVCAALFTARAVPADADASRPAVGSTTCSTHALSVRIAEEGPATETVWGRLCVPRHHRPSTVQLLVHGATYNHLYWDFPVGDGYYSYVRAAAAAGYATFNIDRIGAGHSSHPPSAQLDAAAGAVALHDAITALRSGAVGGHAFAHVVYVGHSFGSFSALYEIPTYHDVDAAILTGMLHGFNPDAGNPLHPAAQDPAFAHSGLDHGYFTTLPGTRGGQYYYPATADPRVIATDEQNKDVTTLNPLPPIRTPDQITVPVLLIVGAKDHLFCEGVTLYDCGNPDTVRTFEARYFLPQADLTVQLIPETGHDLALSTTAPLTDATMLQWSLSKTDS